MKLMFYLSTFYLIVQSIKSNEESKSKDYLFTKERVHLEAFKTFKTDKILANKNSTLSDYNELIWVSIGSPRLIEMPTLSNQTYNNTSSLFDFTDEHFSVYFEMLTLQDRDKLKQAVLDKKGINISASAFILI